MAKRAIYRKMPPHADMVVNLDDDNAFDLVADAFDTLKQRHNRVLRVIGYSPQEGGAVIEVVLDETPLRLAMYNYSARILGLSIVIALATATLVFVSLQWMMVRPIRRLTENMVGFRTDPENPAQMIVPSGRRDEIGMAERELSIMQRDSANGAGATRAFGGDRHRGRQDQSRSSQYSSDGERGLGSACDGQRSGGGQDGAATRAGHRPRRRSLPPDARLRSRRAAAAAAERVSASRTRRRSRGGSVPGQRHRISASRTDSTAEPEIAADRDQLFRVLANLARNAIQAGANIVRVTATDRDGFIDIAISDNGPGLPARRANICSSPLSVRPQPNQLPG